ncbi:MAG TPA: hypothetical protein VM282_05565 [Acidimicrobiales bacterium]|nr:hypothetical protein [Acidimicrobiales bacterium]
MQIASLDRRHLVDRSAASQTSGSAVSTARGHESFTGGLADIIIEQARLARQATDIGLLRADGAGSWTHPSLDRLIHGDGKGHCCVV